MSAKTLPPPVGRAIEATNNADMEGFLDQFAEDGVVDDWGRRFTGRQEIRGWSDRESIGKQQTFTVERFVASGDTVMVYVRVGGNGFNGPSTFTFTVEGDSIREMKISQ